MIVDNNAFDATRSQGMLSLQQGALTALRGTPYSLSLCLLEGTAQARLNEFARFIDYHHPEGVLLTPPLSDLDELAGLCRERAIPYSRIGHAPDPADRNYLRCDDRGAAREAVDRLVALGHRRIALIAGPEEDPAMRQRELGYLEGMARHGLDRGPLLVAAGDGSSTSGRASAALLIELSPAPTAIIASSERMAAGAFHTLQAAALRVPDDISLIGFGDGSIAATGIPQLAAMHVPYAEMAAAAIRRLVDPRARAGPSSPFVARLIPGGTLAAAP